MPRRPKNAAGEITPIEGDLVEGCLEALEELVPVEGHELEWQPRDGERPVDGLLDLRIAGQRVRYAVEVKRALRKDLVGPLAHLAHEVDRHGDRLLVCAERIPDALGEELRAHGLAYLDLGGNAHLPGPGLYVLIAGRRPAGTAQRGARLTMTVTRLLGVFLRDADAGEAVQTDLAKRAGIALGAVGRARDMLTELGVLRRGGPRLWWVADRTKGLRFFAEGWATTRHRLNPRRCRGLETKGRMDLEQQLVEQGDELGCLLGGELAAGRLTEWLRTERATLHVPPGEQRATMRALTLVPDETGPITLLERYGEGDAYEHPKLPGLPLAHPLFVWAECLTDSDERVLQAAERLHDQLLYARDG